MDRAFNKRINQFLFFVFKNNFLYTQLAFVFHLQEDHNFVHGLIDVFFFSFSEKFLYQLQSDGRFMIPFTSLFPSIFLQ